MNRAWCHASEQMAFLQASATDGAGWATSSRDPFPGQEWTSPGLGRAAVGRRPVMYDVSSTWSAAGKKENAHQRLTLEVLPRDSHGRERRLVVRIVQLVVCPLDMRLFVWRDRGTRD